MIFGMGITLLRYVVRSEPTLCKPYLRSLTRGASPMSRGSIKLNSSGPLDRALSIPSEIASNCAQDRLVLMNAFWTSYLATRGDAGVLTRGTSFYSGLRWGCVEGQVGPGRQRSMRTWEGLVHFRGGS